MRTLLHIALVVMAPALLTGCVKTRQHDVWELYDVRHPVPANSSVPISRATQYDPYIDNDEYYTPPDAYPTDPD